MGECTSTLEDEQYWHKIQIKCPGFSACEKKVKQKPMYLQLYALCSESPKKSSLQFLKDLMSSL